MLIIRNIGILEEQFQKRIRKKYRFYGNCEILRDSIKILWLLSVSSLDIDLRKNCCNIKTNNIEK